MGTVEEAMPLTSGSFGQAGGVDVQGRSASEEADVSLAGCDFADRALAHASRITPTTLSGLLPRCSDA